MDPFIKRLQERLQEPLPGWLAHRHLMPESRKYDDLNKSLHPAAVLISLFQKDLEWFFPLIRRTADGFAHSGQIALPGGRREAGENDIETALREAHEEVNILPEEVEVIGTTSTLPIPVSKHVVQPVVGFTQSIPDFTPEPREVADIFYLSVRELCEQEVQQESWHFKGRDWDIPFFDVQGNKVWGATAMILSEFRTLAKEVI